MATGEQLCAMKGYEQVLLVLVLVLLFGAALVLHLPTRPQALI